MVFLRVISFIIVASIMSMSLAIAIDSNWIFIWKGKEDGIMSKYYYDKNSIQKINQNVWQVNVKREDISEGDWAIETGAQFDCKAKTYKGGKAVTYISSIKQYVEGDWSKYAGWLSVSKYPPRGKILNLLCK